MKISTSELKVKIYYNFLKKIKKILCRSGWISWITKSVIQTQSGLIEHINWMVQIFEYANICVTCASYFHTKIEK